MNGIEELVKLAANGDRAAFDSLYEQTKSGVWFTCIGLLKNEENAKDIMQDTYLAAFEKLGTLENPAAFRTWLNKIAANKCKNFITSKSNSTLAGNSEEIFEKIPDDRLIPEDYVTNAEKRRIIMDIIEDALSVNQFRTVILYYFDELSIAEIAELMECHEKTVQYRLKTARIKIKEEITRYEEENNDRLHAVAPFLPLAQLFSAQAENISVPSMSVPNISSASSNALPNALNVPSDQAAAAVKTGGKTMLNTLKAKIIAGACAATVVGGGVTAGVVISNNSKNKTESRPAVSATTNANLSKPSNVSTPVNNSTPTESSAIVSTPTQSVPEAPSTRKDRIGNLELHIPSSFVDEQARNRGLFRQTLENGDVVYFIRSAQADYVELNDDNDFTENDVPAILQSSILRECDMDRYYPCYENLMSFTTEKEESTSVLGFPFLYRTGMMHMEHREDIADLHYAAYYGVIPFVDYNIEKAPVQWIAACETDDPDTIRYLEELVKNVAEGAVFLD